MDISYGFTDPHYKYTNEFKLKFNFEGLDICEDSLFLTVCEFLQDTELEIYELNNQIENLIFKRDKLKERCQMVSDIVTPELFRKRKEERK